MKHIILFLALTISLNSCTTERGTNEVGSLSRKVFDSLKENDFGGIKEIIPNKSSFEKLKNMQGQNKNNDIDSAYSEFLKLCEAEFFAFRALIPDWKIAVYANTNDEVAKEESATLSKVIAKIKVKEEVKKFTFTAAKINGKWFYFGGLKFIDNTKNVNAEVQV